MTAIFDVRMVTAYPRVAEYLLEMDVSAADPLDRVVYQMMTDRDFYRRADDMLGRKFRHGRGEVDGMDRGGRKTKIKREELVGRSFRYLIAGEGGQWYEPRDRIWCLGMAYLARQ